MSLYDASVYGLRSRVGRLRADLDNWAARAADASDLGLHDTQMQRLRDQIEGTLDAAIEGSPLADDTPPPFAGSIDDVARLRRTVGTVHLIWDFFRDKLAQRDVHNVVDHLDAADDLAWACYEPFLDAAIDARDAVALAEVKEPPLVFYGTDRAPYSQARTMTLQPPGLNSRDTQIFSEVLRRLPVPVISMPWSVAGRVPELVLIGHETGHVVAEDLGLTELIRARIRGLAYPNDDESRARTWEQWADEVWADVFATMATGSSFVGGLTLELTDADAKVRLEPIDRDHPGEYPTAALRIEICEQVLRRVGIEPTATWRATYGEPVGQSHAFVDDVPLVVEALLDGRWAPLGDRSLRDLLEWSADAEASVRAVADSFLREAAQPGAYSIRRWIAAAMHAFVSQPQAYRDRNLDEVIARRIGHRRGDVVRSEPTHDRVLTRILEEMTSATASELDAELPGGAERRIDVSASDRRRLHDRLRHRADVDAGRGLAEALGLTRS